MFFFALSHSHITLLKFLVYFDRHCTADVFKPESMDRDLHGKLHIDPHNEHVDLSFHGPVVDSNHANNPVSIESYFTGMYQNRSMDNDFVLVYDEQNDEFVLEKVFGSIQQLRPEEVEKRSMRSHLVSSSSSAAAGGGGGGETLAERRARGQGSRYDVSSSGMNAAPVEYIGASGSSGGDSSVEGTGDTGAMTIETYGGAKRMHVDTSGPTAKRMRSTAQDGTLSIDSSGNVLPVQHGHQQQQSHYHHHHHHHRSMSSYPAQQKVNSISGTSAVEESPMPMGMSSSFYRFSHDEESDSDDDDSDSEDDE